MLFIILFLAYVSNWGIWPFWTMDEEGNYIDPSEDIILNNLEVEKVYNSVELSRVLLIFIYFKSLG